MPAGATCTGPTFPSITPAPPTKGYIYPLTSSAYCSGPSCGENVLASKATFVEPPGGVVVDAVGDIFIADSEDGLVREIDAKTGLIHSVIGNENGSVSITVFPAIQDQRRPQKSLRPHSVSVSMLWRPTV